MEEARLSRSPSREFNVLRLVGGRVRYMYLAPVGLEGTDMRMFVRYPSRASNVGRARYLGGWDWGSVEQVQSTECSVVGLPATTSMSGRERNDPRGCPSAGEPRYPSLLLLAVK